MVQPLRKRVCSLQTTLTIGVRNHAFFLFTQRSWKFRYTHTHPHTHTKLPTDLYGSFIHNWQMSIAKEEANLKKLHTAWIPTLWCSGNSKTYETVKKISGSYVFGSTECIDRAWRILGQWKYSVWCHNDGHMSLFICPNSENVKKHQEWMVIGVITLCQFYVNQL